MSTPAQPGFYGKIPALGDFVSRRLPRQFIELWDGWLESAIATSREQLGPKWLDYYLTCPIWRFGFTAGLLGDKAWAGILMSSVDKVGRYFPLTLAAPLPDGEALPLLFDGARDWFEMIEQLALSSLGDDFDLEEFDGALKESTPPELGWAQIRTEETNGEANRGKFVVCVSVGAPAELPSAFAGISAGTLDRFLPSYSLWCTEGSDSFHPSLLVCEGLPPINAYAAFLSGDWPHHGWNIRSWSRASSPDRPPIQPSANEFASNPSPLVSPVCENVKRQWRWVSYGISETGHKRKINQDAFVECPEIGLWAVADGMGGHRMGEVASAAVVDALAAIPPTDGMDQAIARVKEVLAKVNSDLWTLAEVEGGGQVIGSTVVALLAVEDSGSVLWAGDSRLYRYRDGGIEQLTRDHSFFEEFMESGGLESAGLGENTHCNVITRAVGADPILNLDQIDIEFRDGDVYLLCSDGLDKEVEPHQISSILGRGDCQSNARELIDAALAHNARDNVTVIVLRCEQVF